MSKRYIEMTTLERRIYDAVRGLFYRPSYEKGGTISHQETVDFAVFFAPAIEEAAQEWIRAYDGRNQRKARDDWENPDICNHTRLEYGTEEYSPATCLDCGEYMKGSGR